MAATQEKTLGGYVKRILRIKEMGIFITLLIIVAVFGIANPVFLSFDNIINVLRTTSFILIIGIAMTFVLISGGLDLSVGSIVALGGVISGLAVQAGIPIPVSIILGLVTGMAVGVFNGFTIAVFKIPPLIVTLGMMYVIKGVVLIITKGAPIFPLPEEFNIIGQGELGGIPYVVIIAVILGIIAHIILTQTTVGRGIHAVGGNIETAYLSGIKINRIKMLGYILTGAAAALTGILLSARLASAQANSGTGYELLVIAAVIIGGTSLFGGSGTILGTAIGALFMTVVSNGMVILKVSVYWQNLVIGFIIILAVGIDQLKRRKIT
jgi:ribose/xylose/arabinose/galactoside ABC-type transport system permease subunit